MSVNAVLLEAKQAVEFHQKMTYGVLTLLSVLK